jgi:transposase
MEACGSAHYWARRIVELGIEVQLLPARYICPYVKRNKTDAADAAALLEAARCADMPPVARSLISRMLGISPPGSV